MLFNVHNLKSPIFRYLLKSNTLIRRRNRSNNSYKVLFFGSDIIALQCLKKINDLRKTESIISRLNVVTANSSKHRTIIEKYADAEGLKTLSWPLQNLQEFDYDLGLIVAFGHLIRKDVLEKFPLGMVNVHPSLLPRWRGAAPIIHTLLHGDTTTGVSLMKIKADKFDVGEIISQRRVPVPPHILLPELTDQLTDIGADMLVECVRGLPESLASATPQTDEGVTYAKKITKEISEVRWAEMDAIQVYNLYRALYGLYPLTTKFRDKTVKLFDAFLDESNTTEQNKPIGTLEYCNERSALKVLCKDKKYIYFKSLRIVGKKRISAVDFYNGYIKNMRSENINNILGQIKT